MSEMKPVPDESTPMPALDASRRTDANLAPQGVVSLDDEAPDAIFTPEGDGESVPGIPPSATDPV
jgi:hypothetical protein